MWVYRFGKIRITRTELRILPFHSFRVNNNNPCFYFILFTMERSLPFFSRKICTLYFHFVFVSSVNNNNNPCLFTMKGSLFVFFCLFLVLFCSLCVWTPLPPVCSQRSLATSAAGYMKAENTPNSRRECGGVICPTRTAWRGGSISADYIGVDRPVELPPCLRSTWPWPTLPWRRPSNTTTSPSWSWRCWVSIDWGWGGEETSGRIGACRKCDDSCAWAGKLLVPAAELTCGSIRKRSFCSSDDCVACLFVC